MKQATAMAGLASAGLIMTAGAVETEDNIIISAYRTPSQVTDLGSAVSTIGQIEFETRQTVFVGDVLQDLPGIAVNRASNAGSQTQVRIRGAEANHVLVRINGIKVNDPAAGDEFDFGNLTAFDIDRVEVVRGPQSALWGSDALAGAIDVRTRRARSVFDVGGFVEGGSFDTYNGGVLVGSTTDNFSMNFSTAYFNTDGTDIAPDGQEDDGYENWTSTLYGDWQIGDLFSLDATIRYTDSSKDIDNDTDFDGIQDDVDRQNDKQQLIAGLGGELDLFDGFWTQTLRGTYLLTGNDDILDGVTTTTSDIDKYGAYYQSDLNFNAGPGPDAVQILSIAADFEREEFSQRGEIFDCFFCVPPVLFDPNQDQSMNNLGLVGEYRATDFAGFAFSFGLRYDNNSEFDDIWTYRATGAYVIESIGGKLHTSLGTGQKSPTFSERYGFFSNQFVGNPDLKPEKSTGFDIGYEQSFGNDRIVADLTYFRAKLEDEIDGFAFDPGTGLSTAENLDGESKRKGVEFDITAAVIDGLDLFASYTYTDSTQPDGAGSDIREIRRPRHMAAFNANYVFLNDRLQANLNVSYTGEQLDTDFGTFQTVKLDAYTLVNFAASINVTDEISVYGRIENLFDEDYQNIFGFATPGIGAYIGVRAILGR